MNSGNPPQAPGRQGDAPSPHRGRLYLVLLTLIFFGPMLGVWVFQQVNPDWQPRLVAHGELIRPPLALQSGALQAQPGEPTPELIGQWHLLYLGGGQCDEACEQVMVDLRQIRRALGKHSDELRVVYLLPATAKSDGMVWPEGLDRSEFPELIVTALPADHAGRMPEELAATLGRQGRFVVVDPYGRAMLRYDAGYRAKDVLEDLKRLLKHS